MIDHEYACGAVGAGAGAASMVAPAPDLGALLPAEPPPPDPALVSSWSAGSMVGYRDAVQRRQAWVKARYAADVQAGRVAPRWGGSAHGAVVAGLAAAEVAAPTVAERAVYAGMLDAYAAAYGLRGWYRYTDAHGAHRVQVNHVRTAAEGDQGRYYSHPRAGAYRPGDPAAAPYWVIDRDSGETVYHAATAAEAADWIAAAEATHPASDRPAAATAGEGL